VVGDSIVIIGQLGILLGRPLQFGPACFAHAFRVVFVAAAAANTEILAVFACGDALLAVVDYELVDAEVGTQSSPDPPCFPRRPFVWHVIARC
jgi:hypothetical protein